jgi:hypothetical protein
MEQILKQQPPKQQIDIQPLKPHPSIFENQPVPAFHRIILETRIIHQIDDIRYPKSGGIYSHEIGEKYPFKGMQYPQALDACNMVKRNIMAYVYPLASKEALLPLIGFALTPWKKKIVLLEKFLTHFIRANDYILIDHYIQKRFYCGATAGIRQFIYIFLKEIGISKPICSLVSKIFVIPIQYDYPYRYIIQDIFTILNKQWLLEDPAKELDRVIKILSERSKLESFQIRFGLFKTILKLMFYHKKFKKAFLRAAKLTDMDQIKLDRIDIWNTLIYTINYNFMGLTDRQRQQIYIDAYGGKLPMKLVTRWKK